jgi:hypothetical protein
VIRVVLAVLLAVALFAAVGPGVDEGRRTHSATRLDGITHRVERAARSLLTHEDPTRPGVAGARRIVRFRLPARSLAAASATLQVDGRRDRIGYRVGGRHPHWTTLRGIDLRTPEGPVVVERPGGHRLVLSLVRDRGVGVVVTRG